VMESVLAAGITFKDDVRSSLPYVEIVTQNKYHYEGVVIDDQRILVLTYAPFLFAVNQCASRTKLPFFPPRVGKEKETWLGLGLLTFTRSRLGIAY